MSKSTLLRSDPNKGVWPCWATATASVDNCSNSLNLVQVENCLHVHNMPRHQFFSQCAEYAMIQNFNLPHCLACTLIKIPDLLMLSLTWPSGADYMRTVKSPCHVVFTLCGIPYLLPPQMNSSSYNVLRLCHITNGTSEAQFIPSTCQFQHTTDNHQVAITCTCGMLNLE